MGFSFLCPTRLVHFEYFLFLSIFLTVVSFLNLSTKYITFKIAKGCSYQDISISSKSTPLKAQPSFSLSNLVTHLSSFSLFKKHSIKTHRKYLCSSKGKCVNFIYWFFLCFSIWQILMLEPKGKNPEYIRINKTTN